VHSAWCIMGLIPGLPESDTVLGNTFLMACYGYILLQVPPCPSKISARGEPVARRSLSVCE
jgi:hypothetical protein